MALSAGQLLENRYRIIKSLAEGGFGTIYLAQDTRLNVECAVKESSRVSEAELKQFRFEAEILAGLKHPSLPNVSDYFSTADGNYLIMEYIDGMDLGEWLHEKGPVPEKEVVTWASQILDALYYLHTLPVPVIHRDIKPSNIKIGRDGRAMLVDFGIAKVWVKDGKTVGSAQAVSPPYSPIEQYGGHEGTDPRSDIYALGATLYLLLGGVHPPDAIQRSTGEHKLRSLRDIAPSVSQKLAKIIMKALELNRNDRWQSVYDMWQALAKLSSQSKPLISPINFTGQFKNKGRNTKNFIPIILGTVAVLITVVAFRVATTTKSIARTKSIPSAVVYEPTTISTAHSLANAVAPYPTFTQTPISLPSATRTATPITPTKTATARPTRTASFTPQPPSATPTTKRATITPLPTATTEPTTEVASGNNHFSQPSLLSPDNGISFSKDNPPILSWTETTSPLGTDQYYVLIISRSGDIKDYTWTKTTSFNVGDDKGWMIDFGPNFSWQVVIAKPETVDPNGVQENPTGKEASDYSDEHSFLWSSGGSNNSGGGGTHSTPAPPPP